MDEQEARIRALEDRVAGQRKVMVGVALAAAAVGAFLFGLSLRPERIPFRPSPGYDDMSGFAQTIVALTVLGWLGAIFDAADFFGREGVYWTVLGLLSVTSLGLFSL